MRFARLVFASPLVIVTASIACALSLAGAAGCGSSETTTVADTGEEDTGVVTYRPDDGPTDTLEAGHDAGDSSAPDDAGDASDAADATGDASADAAETAPKTVDVSVGGASFAFTPSTVNVHVGDTVKWTWASSGHNVVSGTSGVADGKFCSPTDTNCATAPTSASGTVYTHTFTTAGTYDYFCKPHATFGMTGKVVVAP